MDEAVKEHLQQELQRAGKALEEQTIELKGLLERLKGITFWMNRNVHLVRWCEDMLKEVQAPRPIFREVNHVEQ